MKYGTMQLRFSHIVFVLCCGCPVKYGTMQRLPSSTCKEPRCGGPVKYGTMQLMNPRTIFVLAVEVL